ncbi:DNA-processing protein DprA [Microbacterium sp. NPDC096154]|uniref:DNA-processing protein DprA n=1 Tax=Microbacterium sp. NPDC096154 TaxID=3155549 RepID=UPI0033304728
MSAGGLLSDPDFRRAAASVAVQGDDREAVAARAAWTALAEPGDAIAGALVRLLGAARALDAVHSAVHDGLLPGIPDVSARELRAAIDRWAPRLDVALLTSRTQAAARSRLALLSPECRLWPARVDDLGDHAPLALWVRGEVAAVAGLERAVALVGARAATPYGEHLSGTLSAELASTGVPIVSGGAYGIDGAAHRAALGAGGLTVAFVAGGADRVYPAAHAHLFSRIAEQGAIVSEIPSGGTPTKWRFLQRNRLIAAASAATVVVEAGWRSGSLNTAGHAATLGRPLGAVPGPVTSATSEGCHRLLREFDAACITRAQDVRELLGDWSGEERSGPDRPRPEAIRVLDALAVRAWRALDDIAQRCGMSLPDVQAQLGLLELDGRIESSAEGWRLART